MSKIALLIVFVIQIVLFVVAYFFDNTQLIGFVFHFAGFWTGVYYLFTINDLGKEKKKL